MTTSTAPAPARGRGRPAIGDRIELRLPAALLAAVDQRAAEAGCKRAELLRWIVAKSMAEWMVA